MGASFKKSGGNRRGGRQQAFSEINITPMVDVMLVLLIIFMVAAPMMTTGVTVDLPQSAAAPVAGQDEPIAVSINARGEVYIQKNPIAIGELQAKLKAVAGEKKDTRIFVRGDKSVGYGKIMQVMGEINAAGFTKVALITDMANSPSRGK